MPRTKKINIGKRKTPNEEKGLSKYKGRGRKSMKEFVDVKIDNSEEVEDEPTIFESQIDNSNTPDINKNDIELLIQKQVQERLEEKLKLLEEKKQKDKEEKMVVDAWEDGRLNEAGLSEVLNGNQFYIEYSKQILNEL